MHHKRGRRKDARAGCLLCKPHKSTTQKGRLKSQTCQERKARVLEKEQRQVDWWYEEYETCS